VLFRYIAWRRLDVETGYGGATVEWGRGTPDGDDQGMIEAVEFVRHGRRSWGLAAYLGLDDRWRCDFAHLNVMTRRPYQSVTIERAGNEAWVVNGRRRRALDGCAELDIAATPLTNTLAIRRLNLDVGREQTVRVAWVDVPSLRIESVEQGYRRIGRVKGSDGLEAYEFWPVGGRTYRLSVDADGLVVDYEDFAERIAG
jgi:uncharacterized protein